jgi:ribosomal protein S25
VSAEDDKRSRRPSNSNTTENVDKIHELIHEEHRRTIHELAHTTGISYGVCPGILNILSSSADTQLALKHECHSNTAVQLKECSLKTPRAFEGF